MSEVLIDGSWRPSQSRAEQLVTNPATLRPVGATASCDALDAAVAMAAARRALGDWKGLPRQTRVALLRQAGVTLQADASGIADLQSQESGQPVFECLEAVHAAAQCLIQDATRPREEPAVARALVLDPDYPLLDWACRAVSLMEEGCTLVCAAPRAAPLAILRAVRCIQGLPNGVLNVLVASPEAVRAGVGRPAVEDGASSQSQAAAAGVDGVFVSDGADLDRTLRASASQRLFHAGQRAGQSARIYVEERMAGVLADRLHEYVAFLECGDPRNPDTDLGPLRSSAALEQVEGQVGRALKCGALLKLGGRRYQPWGLRGYFFQPTVMIEGRGAERVPDCEIHGPVLIISPVRNLAEAVSQETFRSLSCFGGQLEAQFQSLSSAGVEFEFGESRTPLERIMRGLRGLSASPLQIEPAPANSRSGFPYRSPPGSLR
ncbi:MAG: aldehyde dehydrogenase family protein [Proteobacteria bacterium]|nr:aldehyde dehydrogenase family protein [Pseudomonadota bacterium]